MCLNVGGAFEKLQKGLNGQAYVFWLCSPAWEFKHDEAVGTHVSERAMHFNRYGRTCCFTVEFLMGNASDKDYA